MNGDLILDEFSFDSAKLVRNSVSLGITRDTGFTGLTKVLEDKQRETTVYIRGITGSGKSRLLQAMVAQDIARGHALCLVDPTGSIYRPTAELIALIDENFRLESKTSVRSHNQKMEKKRESFRSRFDLLDFGGRTEYRFNPLYVDRERGETASEIVGDFMKTVSRIIGDLTETRRLKIILESACQLLAEAGGTLLDVPTLLKMDEQEIREFIGKLDNKAKAEGWKVRSELARWYMEEFFSAMRPAQRLERMESTINALGVWLSDPMIRRFVDCRQGNLDFNTILNEGRVLLCHVPLGASTDSTRVLGSLIVNKIQRQAYRRTVEQRKRPFSLYADEFHLFVDEEFAIATATVRQFGLRLLLAHQSAEQPPLNTEEGQGILQTIMANSGTKIFFRLGVSDAERVEKEIFLFGKEPDAEGKAEYGHKIKRKFTDITHTIQKSRGFTSSRSIARGLSESLTRSRGITRTTSEGVNFTYTEGEGVSRSEVHSAGVTVTKSKNSSRTVSKSTGVSITRGENETHIEARGTAEGESKSEGRSRSAGTSEGSSITSGSNNASSFSTHSGSSMSHDMGDYDINSGRMAMSENMGNSHSSSVSKAVSDMNSSFQSESESYSKAVSKIISASQALAKGTSTSRGTTETKGEAFTEGEGRSEALSRQISEGVTEIENISRAMGQSLSKAVSIIESEAVGITESKTVSDSFSKSESVAVGESERTVVELYTLEEESALNAQVLYTLPPRQAWIVTQPEFDLDDDEFGESGVINAVEFKTHTIKGSFEVAIEDSSLLKKFIEDNPPEPWKKQDKSVFETAGMNIRETFDTGDEEVEGFL